MWGRLVLMARVMLFGSVDISRRIWQVTLSANNSTGLSRLRHPAAQTRTSRRVKGPHETRHSGESPDGMEADPVDLPTVGPPSGLAARLKLLGKTLRPTPHVPLAMTGIHLFAKLEYVNP